MHTFEDQLHFKFCKVFYMVAEDCNNKEFGRIDGVLTKETHQNSFVLQDQHKKP